MERRDALKNIGLSFGAITMSSTLASLVQSCSTGEATWIPKFFTADEAVLVENTLALILPTTPNIPGASELNLAQFIDGYNDKILKQSEKDEIKAGISLFLSTTLASTGKSKVSDLTSEDLDGRLAYYLNADAAQQKAWEDKNGDDFSNFSTLKSLRGRGIWAFKISQEIGENVLAYAPVPGEQRGCIDVQEATGGKAWSL
ncbi:MAG: gluconate 2-dehydrogenase subunit 3 family protein [Cyclobacteriaceae bacterium]|nr:gluconate 2-dehydrogenase subunit 3 family protein [Cyclobacteriaceae bacterium]